LALQVYVLAQGDMESPAICPRAFERKLVHSGAVFVGIKILYRELVTIRHVVWAFTNFGVATSA
jgi:hypothetical protein